MRVVHLTSVHPWNDTRIFLKMCRSLAEAGHETHLVVPARDFGAARRLDGVTIHPVRLPANRAERMLFTSRVVFAMGAELGGDIYHFHDPECLDLAVRWQERLGKGFVYDAHEDYRLDILSKRWLPGFMRKYVAGWFGRKEDLIAGKLAGIVAATPSIAGRFLGRNDVLATVQNFPLSSEIIADGEKKCKPPRFIYTGAVSHDRGILEMLAALPLLTSPARLGIAGEFRSGELRRLAEASPGWSGVDAYGFLDRKRLCETMSGSIAGMVLYAPIPSHVCSQPTKLFEYMAAGLPVIASDFPAWREIVEGSGCGLLADPLDPASIAGAMNRILSEPGEAEAMGVAGRNAVAARYGWEGEFRKLLELYNCIVA